MYCCHLFQNKRTLPINFNTLVFAISRGESPSVLETFRKTVRLAILLDKRAQFVKDTVVKDKYCFCFFCFAELRNKLCPKVSLLGASGSVKNRISVARKFFASPLTRHCNEH